MECTVKMKKNELRIQEVQEVAGKEYGSYKDMTECCTSLEAALKSLAFLLDELEAESMSSLTKSLVGRVQRFWNDEVRPCLAGKTALPAQTVALERLCVEATIACPQDEQFRAMQVELAVHMRDELNGTKVAELMTEVASMEAKLVQGEMAEILEPMPTLTTCVDACKGLTLGTEQEKVMRKLVTALVAKMQSLVSSDLKTSKAIYNFCVACKAWLPSSCTDQELPQVNAIIVLTENLQACVGGG